MIRRITKVGNSNGIIFDSTLMDMAHLKTGDEMSVEIHDGGTITLRPIRQNIESKRAARTAARLIRANSELFRRLA